MPPEARKFGKCTFRGPKAQVISIRLSSRPWTGTGSKFGWSNCVTSKLPSFPKIWTTAPSVWLSALPLKRHRPAAWLPGWNVVMLVGNDWSSRLDVAIWAWKIPWKYQILRQIKSMSEGMKWMREFLCLETRAIDMMLQANIPIEELAEDESSSNMSRQGSKKVWGIIQHEQLLSEPRRRWFWELTQTLGWHVNQYELLGLSVVLLSCVKPRRLALFAPCFFTRNFFATYSLRHAAYRQHPKRHGVDMTWLLNSALSPDHPIPLPFYLPTTTPISQLRRWSRTMHLECKGRSGWAQRLHENSWIAFGIKSRSKMKRLSRRVMMKGQERRSGEAPASGYKWLWCTSATQPKKNVLQQWTWCKWL